VGLSINFGHLVTPAEPSLSFSLLAISSVLLLEGEKSVQRKDIPVGPGGMTFSSRSLAEVVGVRVGQLLLQPPKGSFAHYDLFFRFTRLLAVALLFTSVLDANTALIPEPNK
jgi:hypothetical protein